MAQPIVILAIGFSLLVKSPSLGTSFVLFYATGFLPYDMYKQMASKIGGALAYSKPMLAYPRVTWLDAIIARFLLNFLMENDLEDPDPTALYRLWCAFHL